MAMKQTYKTNLNAVSTAKCIKTYWFR